MTRIERTTSPAFPARRTPRRFARALAALALAALAACASAPSEDAIRVRADGDIRARADGATLSRAQFAARLADADVVLIGERHDNAEHHRLQAWIVGEMAKRRPVAVVFEMIDATREDALAAFLAERPRDAATLGVRLDWDASGWPDWALYRPIADAALAQPTPPARPIAAGNLPPATARDIARAGAKAESVDAALRDSLRRAEGEDAALLAVHAADIRDGHCGMLPERLLGTFALAQYARDETMARAIIRAAADGARVALIAGNGHARKDVGVPRHLARLAPDLKVLSMGLIEGAGESDGAPFDIVWRTAAVERGDPCAAFAKPAS
ncbi:MAG: ChaN family lipoprotein [Alphaproteobacteria bacterium]